MDRYRLDELPDDIQSEYFGIQLGKITAPIEYDEENIAFFIEKESHADFCLRRRDNRRIVCTVIPEASSGLASASQRSLMPGSHKVTATISGVQTDHPK